MLNEDQRRLFREEGYHLAKGVFKAPDFRPVFAALANLLEKHRPGSIAQGPASVDPASPGFHEALKALRKEDRMAFSAIYDSLQTNHALFQFLGHPTLSRVAADLMDTDPVGLSATGHMLRLDPPADSRNSLRWHQEISYHQQNEDGANGLVCWIPMQDVSRANGTVQVCLGSHLHGKLAGDGFHKEESLASEQYQVKEETASRFRYLDVDAEAGDALFFNLYMIHRSGVNSSDRFRFTAGIRFHKMLSHDFIPCRIMVQPTHRRTP